MKGNFEVLVVLWTILAAVVIALAVYRKWVARGEDDSLHVLEDAVTEVPRQAAMSQRLDIIDRWGKILTVVALVYGVALAVVYLFNVWTESSKTVWTQ
ncbi:MAG: hypothetical protein HYR60_08680 [Acidobacteria bacterium]|nr:hypothetical protein [Acidobacteriota bacterium]MBI3470323.1 hypothetical protein [Candidatus Solibacter usitatus]